ncbi:MAG TPA: DUF4214 domain-containing protein [Pirellulales bacterium]|nr:DUF4214 domain-containing protein [Pirellulales bacterium]
MFGKRHAIEWLEKRVLLSATPTSIAVSASSSSIVVGQAVTLTADVSAPLGFPSEGTVVFSDNGAPLGTAPVSSGGVATLADVRLPTGADLITASYVDPGGTFASSSTVVGPHSTIETVAGGALPSGLPAVDASISPQAVAVDSSGDLFIADNTLDVVFEVHHATGVATIVAGNGAAGFSGDGGPATAAELNDPEGVAVDSSGHLFIADGGNERIREVELATGAINTVAGNGSFVFSGDGGPATAAGIGIGPAGVAVDSAGDLFIADTNHRIREVDHATGIITTVAGSGTGSFSGDGGPATAAGLGQPFGIAADSAGDLFIAVDNRVREVIHATGVITTVAGNGTGGFSGDGGPATAAGLSLPFGIAVDSAGDLFISDLGARVREVNHATGIITTVAGNGTYGFSGDGGSAAAAEFNTTEGVAVDSSGDLFISDVNNRRIREVDLATGVVTTVAGNGTRAFSGDGGLATAAEVDSPQNIAVDSSGDLFIADSTNNRVREVNRATGIITTVAGNGTAGFSGDGGPATAAELQTPEAIAVDSSGDLFIADNGNSRIREINLTTGVITTVAGHGAYGFSGDGGPATAAEFSYVKGIAVDSSGDLFFADGFNDRIREINHATGIITTVAGNGTMGSSGDGGLAIAAELTWPEGVAVDSSGHLFIAGGAEERIREVNLATGVITTVAGNGVQGSSGDGGSATAASLLSPEGVAVDSSGDLFIADRGNNRIREVNLATDIITTIAGNGTAGFSGDGGRAGAAELSGPAGVLVDSSGELFIADTGSNRIREMSKGAVVNVTEPFVVNDAIYTIGSGVVSVSAADGLLRNYSTMPEKFTVTPGTVAGAEGGSFAFYADGSFTYTPPAKFPGFDYAKYTVSDSQGENGTATVDVLSQIGGVVWKFYEQVLHRAPDYGGLQFWINDFSNGGKTGDIAAGFFESDELLDQIVTGYYQQYLLRTADASGLVYWKQVWRATGGPEVIKAGFADSPEFYASAGGAPQSWITELYHRILGRDPDPQGNQFWLNYLTSHGNTAATQNQIALGFFTSPETYKGDVTGWFQEYLQRAPTAGELNQYAGEMQAGKTDRDIEQEITNLPEYAGNPPTPPAGTATPLPDYYQTPASSGSSKAVVAAKDAFFSRI